MALRKEPERRYGSAAQLAQDIDRYLHDMPVSARTDTFGYRARKFVVRNRAIVAATGLALTLLAFTIAAYTWRLERERDRAELAAAKSQRVTQFLVHLFREADPWLAPGSTRTAADLLEQGLQDIDRLADQPALQAELLHVMGASYTSLGSFDTSIPLLERSLALYRADSASDPETVALVLNDLGHTLRVAGQLTRADGAA
jgi:serine/threonine-protein kinase